ncbi:MAG: hypothetical protein ACF8PG_17255 [Maioricimonas sp. JB045]
MQVAADRPVPAVLVVYVALFLTALPEVSAASDDSEVCQVRVILFLPSDVPRPAIARQRADEIVRYAETFLLEGLQRWGHEPPERLFRWQEDGHVELLEVKGDKTADEYQGKPILRREAVAKAREQYSIRGDRHVWWIFVCMGDPPARYENYLGGFDQTMGGWALANFDTRPGTLDPDCDIAGGFAQELTIKGLVHELGHGFGLPHIGPKRAIDGGNTLMGPNTFNFHRVAPKTETRAYLSETAAAILARHPAFRGVPDKRDPLPSVQVEVFKAEWNRRTRATVVTGRVESSSTPVTAIVRDESDARPGEYWTKHYIGEVKEDGTFRVVIDEPSPAGGTLKLFFVFENGALTGNGKNRGARGAPEKAYRFVKGNFLFGG